MKTTIKLTLLGVALALGTFAQAQDAGKKALVERLLKAQQPAHEMMARRLVEQPAALMMQQAVRYVQAKAPAEQREAIVRDLQAEARKYFEDTYPYVRETASRLAASTVGELLEQRMTEAELRDVLAVYESPSWQKYQSLAPEMERALGERLVQDVKAQVEPKVRALDQALIKRLGVTAPASAAGTGR